MTIALSLLGDVRWRERPVTGDRPQALLAALAGAAGRAVTTDALVEQVWGDDAPANGQKSLQVLVSRTRSACGADAVLRDGAGYRLGAGPDEIDSVRLAGLVRAASAALDSDAALAAGYADDALALANGLSRATGSGAGPLRDIRAAAAADTRAAREIRARALSRTGAHAEALPVLEIAYAGRPRDEPLLADLLRSEAAVRGPAAALERYERYRRGLRDQLGADPGEVLRRTHRDLLALDRPVRTGVRYDATALIGRDQDLDRLRALTASSRVVSIVGTGGLGKTRLAQAIAREAAVPAVHVVELAGVSAAADVLGEVGAALGVRDSIQGRRVLTPEQRADVRGRIAQRLGQSPGLLVLDNCEHLIDAVADLVAFLVTAASDVHVLTTSRAPLGIAAERVYLLGELEPGDAAELFRERAVAARPSVRLSEPAVTSVVERLDGLPLAIELAAAQVRAMSVEEIDRRLENRFALLRGGDRSAPDRHRTLIAVIDWSWNLLDAGERRALRWLALFNDGFTLAAAGAVLGADAVVPVQGLVSQSLLSVAENHAGVRYRMLETVREFGRMQLTDAGEDAEARAALRRWAAGYAHEQGGRLGAADQFAAIDAVAAEEVNLADELRNAITDGDRSSMVKLMSSLGLFWIMRGAHIRLMLLAGDFADAMGGWEPPPELAAVTRTAVAILLANSLIAGNERAASLRPLMRRLGTDPGDDARISAMTSIMLEYDPADPGEFARGLERLAESRDRETAVTAGTWLSNSRENSGDITGAIGAAERALALVSDADGPWLRATLRAQLAELTAQGGERAVAAGLARAALPVMQRLGAIDDELQLRVLLVFCAIADGQLEDAGKELARVEALAGAGITFGGVGFHQVGVAELLLARGEPIAGLALYRECAARMREFEFPGIARTGLEPWALFGEATALAAHAWFAAGPDAEHGRALFRACRRDALGVLGQADMGLDYPVAGLVLFGLGAWALLRRAAPADDAVRVLALADRFAYSRMIPTLFWERIAPLAENAAPGLIGELAAGYAAVPLPGLLTQARQAVEKLPA